MSSVVQRTDRSGYRASPWPREGTLVSGVPLHGQPGAPARAYGRLEIPSRGSDSREPILLVGPWKVDPDSLVKIRGREKALLRVFLKTEGHCHFCGDPLSFEQRRRGKSDSAWESDHIFQLKKGGPRGAENTLPTCWRCNQLRWGRTGDSLRRLLVAGLVAIQEIERRGEASERLLELIHRREVGNAGRRLRYREKNGHHR